MSEMIKMKGRLLRFDNVNANGVVIPKDSKLIFPDRIPVMLERNFDFVDPTTVVGFATVHRDDKGLICDVELTNFDLDVLRNDYHNELCTAGFYVNVKMHEEDEKTVVDEASLYCVMITDSPADGTCKVMVVEEEKEGSI